MFFDDDCNKHCTALVKKSIFSYIDTGYPQQFPENFANFIHSSLKIIFERGKIDIIHELLTSEAIAISDEKSKAKKQIMNDRLVTIIDYLCSYPESKSNKQMTEKLESICNSCCELIYTNQVTSCQKNRSNVDFYCSASCIDFSDKNEYDDILNGLIES